MVVGLLGVLKAGGGYVPLEQLIGHNLDLLFLTSEPIHYWFFRVTRGAWRCVSAAAPSWAGSSRARTSFGA